MYTMRLITDLISFKYHSSSLYNSLLISMYNNSLLKKIFFLKLEFYSINS